MSVSSESGGEPGMRLAVGPLKAALNRPEVISAGERPGALTKLRRLDPEKLHIWLDEYSLGVLWRTGELGANP